MATRSAARKSLSHGAVGEGATPPRAASAAAATRSPSSARVAAPTTRAPRSGALASVALYAAGLAGTDPSSCVVTGDAACVGVDIAKLFDPLPFSPPGTY